MGRPENPLDPSDGPLAAFAWELRQLRAAAGTPTYRQLSRRAGYSSTALSDAASGRQLPSLDVTLAFVGSCGGDTGTWEERWRQVAAGLTAVPPENAVPENAVPPENEDHERRLFPAPEQCAVTSARTGETAGGLPSSPPPTSFGRPPLPPADSPVTPGTAPEVAGHPAAPAAASPGAPYGYAAPPDPSWAPVHDVAATGRPVRYPGLGPSAGALAAGPVPRKPAMGITERPDSRAGQRHRHARHRPRRNHVPVMIAGILAVTAAAGLVALRPWAAGSQRHAGTAGAAGRRSQTATAPPARQQHNRESAHSLVLTGGPFCPSSSAVVLNPYQAPNGDGWHSARPTGGQSGPCGTSFLYSRLASVPGDPDQWHDDFDWTFSTGLAAPSCTLNFYVPASGYSDSSVYYWISAGSENSSDQIASFTIDQAGHRGQWVTRGPFTFPGGTVFIELTDRGEGPLTADAVAAPVRVIC